jgi:hypothetical protein
VIDIEARHEPTLTRDEHDAPARRLNCRLQADVGEVGDREDIDHTPGVVGDVAPHLETYRLSHDAARSIAADHVAGVDGEALIAPGEPDPNRMAAFRPDVKTFAADPIIGREPVHGAAHDSQQMLEHPRLVDDDMRECRKLVVCVLDAPRTDNPAGIGRVGAPERQLIDPVGLREHTLAHAEGVEHLDRAARDPVGLPELERPGATLHDAGRDPFELSELRGQDEAGRPAADDEHIDLALLVQPPHDRRRLNGHDRRVPRVEAVEVELHALLLSLLPQLYGRALDPDPPTDLADAEQHKAPQQAPRSIVSRGTRRHLRAAERQ